VIEDFERDGHWVRRGLATEDELARLSEIHARLFALPGRITTSVDDRFRVTLERVTDPAREAPALLETSFWREGCQTAAHLLAVPPDRMQAMLALFRKPAGAPASPLHQHAVTAGPARNVSLWMPLCASELMVAPLPPSVLPHDRWRRLSPPLPNVTPLLLAGGDAVFLHDRLIHGARPNQTDHPRPAILLHAWTRTV
jgi:hypothetical protein